jgi:hypothetical protein
MGSTCGKQLRKFPPVAKAIRRDGVAGAIYIPSEGANANEIAVIYGQIRPPLGNLRSTGFQPVFLGHRLEACATNCGFANQEV